MEPGTQAVMGVPLQGALVEMPTSFPPVPLCGEVTASPALWNRDPFRAQGQGLASSHCPAVQWTGEAILCTGLNLPASEPWFPKQRWPSSAEAMGGTKNSAQVFAAQVNGSPGPLPEDSEGTEATF